MKKLLAMVVVGGFLVGTLGCTGGASTPGGSVSKPTGQGSSGTTHPSAPRETSGGAPRVTSGGTHDTHGSAPKATEAAKSTEKPKSTEAPKDTKK